MGVPSTRTPVRIARGTYANLTTAEALASLQEGEICFSTDENKLYVKEGSGLTSVSSTKSVSPIPSEVTASPAFTGGDGTQGNPYLITNGAVPFAGGTATSAQQITIQGTPGDFVVFTDNSPSGSANRFAAQDVGIVNSAGEFTLNLKYVDTPATTSNNTTYTGNLQIGSVYFTWVVVQSNLTGLATLQDTTIVMGGLGIGANITATAGIATGGTYPYNYDIRWQRSFTGTDGWFDNNATGNVYTLVNADAGYYVRAVTKATDDTAGSSGGPLTIDMPSASSPQINIAGPPDITQVQLTANNINSNRFTDETFGVTTILNPEGVPTSAKSIKVKFQGTFTDYPSTDNVTLVKDQDPFDLAVAEVNTANMRRSYTGFTPGIPVSSGYPNSDQISAFYSNSNVGANVYSNETNRHWWTFNDGKNVTSMHIQQGASSSYNVGLYGYGFSETSKYGEEIPPGELSTDSFSMEYYYSSDEPTEFRYNYNQYKTNTGEMSSYNYSATPLLDANSNVTTVFYRPGNTTYQELAFLAEVEYRPGNDRFATNGSKNYGGNVKNSENFNRACLQFGNKFFLLAQHSWSYNSSNVWARVYTDITEQDLNNNNQWRYANHDSYTDITESDFFGSYTSSGNVELSGIGHPYNESKYIMLYHLRESGSTYYDLLVCTCEKTDDPSVVSNWTRTKIPSSTYAVQSWTDNHPNAQETYVDGDGRIIFIYTEGITISNDYGANWTTTTWNNGAQSPNFVNAGDSRYWPWYIDGHYIYLQRGDMDSNNNGYMIRTSQNNGQSFTDAYFLDDNDDNYMNEVSTTNNVPYYTWWQSPFFYSKGYLLIKGRYSGSTYEQRIGVWQLLYSTDLTFAGNTNFTNDTFREGDRVRQGNANGVISGITTASNQFRLNETTGTFVAGSPVENTISHVGGTSGTRFATISNSGAVSDLVSGDPGFVQYGYNNNFTVTMPSILPTGNTPDVELPVGASMQVTIQADNNSGIDTHDSSVITPTN